MSNEKKWVCCLSLSLCCFLSVVAWSSWKLALWLAVPKLISCLQSGEFQPQTVIRYFWVVLSVWVSDFWIECASFLMSTLIMRLINLMNDRFKAWPCCHGYVQQVILFPRACHNQLGEVTSLGLVVSCITLLIKSVSLKYHMFFEPTPPQKNKKKNTPSVGPMCPSILRNNAGLRSHNKPTAFSETSVSGTFLTSALRKPSPFVLTEYLRRRPSKRGEIKQS